MLNPIVRTNAPIDDEPLTDEDAQAIRRSEAWFEKNGGRQMRTGRANADGGKCAGQMRDGQMRTEGQMRGKCGRTKNNLALKLLSCLLTNRGSTNGSHAKLTPGFCFHIFDEFYVSARLALLGTNSQHLVRFGICGVVQ
jgi:hypothetical protein